MIDLLKEVKARLEAVLDGELFDDPAHAAGLSVPTVRIGGLDPKRSGGQDDEDFPFVVVRPRTGGSDLSREELYIELIAGVWTPGNVLDGYTAIDRMLELLLTMQGDRIYTPYHMRAKWKWSLGDKNGSQPHPYYYLTVSVPFKRAPQATARS